MAGRAGKYGRNEGVNPSGTVLDRLNSSTVEHASEKGGMEVQFLLGAPNILNWL